MKNITGIQDPEQLVTESKPEELASGDQTLLQVFTRFTWFGCLAWGGPVAQIAMIKKELVEEEQWVKKEEFNRALALYQALPGPEAHELCVYFGMKARGRWGGFLAGLGFMLPGFLLMLSGTWLYIRFGLTSPVVQYVFTGIQVSVIALIAFAVYRIGKHAIVNLLLFGIAILSGIAFFVGVNFILILLAGGVFYACWQKKYPLVALTAIIILSGLIIYNIVKIDKNEFSPQPVALNQSDSPRRSAPLVLLTGLKAGLLTFGGAYTAIPFVQEDAVEKYKWMSQDEFLDGVAISGVIPAPLIIFSTFTGYFGGGWPGAILITIGVFFPAFAFTLIGYSTMQKLIANKALHSFLDGITACVVGLIAVTALELLFSKVTTPLAVIIFTLSLTILIRYRSKYSTIIVILAGGVLSFTWSYLYQ